jgi:hypothetical protein
MEKKKRFCELCFTRDRSFVAAAMHIDDQDLCLAHIRAEQLNPEDGEAIPADEIPVVDAALARAIDKSRQAKTVKVQKESAPIEARGEEAMSKHLCACECGTELSKESYERGWRYVRGHKPAAGSAAAKEAVTLPSKPAPAAAAPRVGKSKLALKRARLSRERVADQLASVADAPDSQGASVGMVTMTVSERFLEAAWARLTPGLKAVAIAAALESPWLGA